MTLDNWLWEDTSVFTRSEKSQNHVKARSKGYRPFLVAFRFSCLVLWIVGETNYWNVKEPDWNLIIITLTGWGWYTWGLFVLLLSLAHFKHDVLG